MSPYFKLSRSVYYAVAAAIPLLLAYEMLLVASAGGSPVNVRNAADAWLRMFLFGFGLEPSQVTLGMILVLILSLPLVRRRETPLRPRYFVLMLIEAAAYSLVLGILIQGILSFLLSPLLEPSANYGAAAVLPALQSGMPTGMLLQSLALSVGAGLFEEFFFRVLLLWGLMAVTRLLFAPWLCAVVSITGAAFLFALAHHIGPLGEPLELHAFLFRWIAGLLFTMLYYVRGFAITAYAHALYDIRILLF